MALWRKVISLNNCRNLNIIIDDITDFSRFCRFGYIGPEKIVRALMEKAGNKVAAE